MKTGSLILQTVKTAILALVAGSLVACQSAPTTDPGSAVICDKCKTVWVSRPVTFGVATKGGSAYTVYRSAKGMECPECESAVVAFFKTGSLQHRCTHCGGALTHCKAH